MRPYWPPNQGERSDRLIYKLTLRLLERIGLRADSLKVIYIGCIGFVWAVFTVLVEMGVFSILAFMAVLAVLTVAIKKTPCS